MKHSTKITVLLIMMFVVTQLIGIFIISIYNTPGNSLPFGMQPPEEIQPSNIPYSILIAFIIAIGLFFILTKINAEKFIRFWFFMVTALALGLTFKALLIFFKTPDHSFFGIPLLYPEISLLSIIVFIVGLTIAFFKIYKRNLIVHNLSELLIYPGIAAVFIPLLNEMGIIILLLVISIYDIWAVWKSQFMQKMAKYQIEHLKFFTGFFIPYANKKDKQIIKKIKTKYKNKSEKFLISKLNKEKVKVNLAILGGGDVIFPIITAGIFYKIYNPYAALIIAAFATIALLALFMFAKKGKFYPAMPFITIGLYLGMIVNWLIF